MKIFTILSLCTLLASCASTNVDVTPIGTWDCSITGTPQGDFLGELIVSSTNGKYDVLLKVRAREISLNNPAYDKTTKKLTGSFNYQGTPVFFESITAGETMTGTLSADGSNFPLKATKKK